MNILQQEDIIKGLPDDALMQEAQAPSGQVPQFLVVSEVQRRADMRKRYQEQQQPQGTVAEQIVGEAQQGIASMQQQGGPPPPQAMPPQGMPPQGMPPQQMFGGGIIRLQGGGQPQRMMRAVDMLAAGATPTMLLQQGYTQAEIELANQTYREKMSAPPPQSQGMMEQISAPQRMERTPNPSILSDPAISDFAREVPGMVQGYPNQMLRGGQELFTGESSADPLGGILAGAKESVADPFMAKFGPYARHVAEDTMSTYEDDGFLPAVGKGIRNLAGLPVAVADGLSDVYGGFLDKGISSLSSTPTLEEVEVTAQKAPEQTVPELSTAIKEAQGNPNDAGARSGSRGQVQGLDDATRQGRTADPSLDFADLIAESKKMSQANALMQLGAGIAGGDLSKGLSAAGTAATRGAQDARKLAMTQRLAEYNAGRQDLDREQKESQFSRRLKLMTDQLDAATQKGERVSRGQLFEMATKLALESSPEFGGGPSVEDIFEQLVRRYAPFMGVDTSNLPPSEIVRTTQSGQTTGRPPLSDFLG